MTQHLKNLSIAVITGFIIWTLVGFSSTHANFATNSLELGTNLSIQNINSINNNLDLANAPSFVPKDKILNKAKTQQSEFQVRLTSISHEELFLRTAISLGLISKRDAQAARFRLSVSKVSSNYPNQESKVAGDIVLKEILGEKSYDLVQRQIALNIQAMEVESLNRTLSTVLLNFQAPIEVSRDFNELIVNARLAGTSPDVLRSQLSNWLEKQQLTTDVIREFKRKLYDIDNSEAPINSGWTLTTMDLPTAEVDRLSNIMGLTSKQYQPYLQALAAAKDDFRAEIESYGGKLGQDSSAMVRAFRNSRTNFEMKLKSIVSPEQYQKYEIERDLSAFDRLSN